MLIGNKAVFGIDFQQNEEYPLYLNLFYFWIKGNRFGSDQEKTKRMKHGRSKKLGHGSNLLWAGEVDRVITKTCAEINTYMSSKE